MTDKKNDSFTHQHTKIKYNKHIRTLLKKKALKNSELQSVQNIMGYGKITPKKELEEEKECQQWTQTLLQN